MNDNNSGQHRPNSGNIRPELSSQISIHEYAPANDAEGLLGFDEIMGSLGGQEGVDDYQHGENQQLLGGGMMDSHELPPQANMQFDNWFDAEGNLLQTYISQGPSAEFDGVGVNGQVASGVSSGEEYQSNASRIQYHAPPHFQNPTPSAHFMGASTTNTEPSPTNEFINPSNFAPPPQPQARGANDSIYTQEFILKYVCDVQAMAHQLTRQQLLDFIRQRAYVELGLPGHPHAELRTALHSITGGVVPYDLQEHARHPTPPPHASGDIGNFRRLPNEMIGEILQYLPMRDIVNFTQTCKTFRTFLYTPWLWSRIELDTSRQLLSIDKLLGFIDSLPAGSIRNLTFDGISIIKSYTEHFLSMMHRRGHNQISSLHIVGANTVTNDTVNRIFHVLGNAKLKIVSIPGLVVGRADASTIIETAFPHCPNIERLRIGGVITAQAMMELATVRNHPPINSALQVFTPNNALTHLAFTGTKGSIEWGTLASFGSLFPGLKSLYISTVVGSDRWANDFQVVSGQANFYRAPTEQEMNWMPMQHLKSFGVDCIGHRTGRNLAKAQEIVHNAFLWALVGSSQATLERLELGHGESNSGRRSTTMHVPRNLPALLPRSNAPTRQIFSRLKYLYLAYWDLDWSLFVGNAVVRDGSVGGIIPPPIQPIFDLRSLEVMACWRCSGLPEYEPNAGRKGLRWLHKLREATGRPKIWGIDHTAVAERDKADGKAMVTAGNVGEGGW